MSTKKYFLIAIAVLLLAYAYLFQQTNFSSFIFFADHQQFHPYTRFIINKTVRLIINDLAMGIIIIALFKESKYLKVAAWLFAFELLVLLPLYLWIKLTVEGDSEISSPLLSQIHRLIINPMLMILLVIGFYYQKLRLKRR